VAESEDQDVLILAAMREPSITALWKYFYLLTYWYRSTIESTSQRFAHKWPNVADIWGVLTDRWSALQYVAVSKACCRRLAAVAAGECIRCRCWTTESNTNRCVWQI